MRDINQEQLRTLRDEKRAAVINILYKKEFEKAKIPGSINIPYKRKTFQRRVAKLVPKKSHAVVLYANAVHKHTVFEAARLLEDAGYISVYVFSEGIDVWRQLGYPLK